MISAGQCAITDAVAIHIFIPGKPAQFLQILGREHLPTPDRLIRVGKRVGHPVVHAQIEIEHDEDRRLELLGQVERLLRHREALFRRGGEEHRMLRVAMGKDGGGQQIALRGAGGQPRGRSDALHIEEHAGNLGVIA